MEIRALEYFLAVADGLTFLEASDFFNISLSSFSKSISKLENELSISLFDRSGRKAKLSEEGIRTLTHLRVIVDEYYVLRDEIALCSGNKNIRILVLPYNTMNFRVLLRDYEDENEHVSIHEVKAYYTKDLFQKPIMKRVHFVITHESILTSQNWEKHVLCNNKLLALISKRHPLANRKSITLYDLKYEHTLIREGTKIILDEIIEDIDDLNFKISEQSREQMIGDIVSKKAIGIFYESDIEIFNYKRADIVVRYINDIVDNPFVIAWQKNRVLSNQEHDMIKFLSQKRR